MNPCPKCLSKDKCGSCGRGTEKECGQKCHPSGQCIHSYRVTPMGKQVSSGS